MAPVGETTEEAWYAVLKRLRIGEAEVRRAVSDDVADEGLDESFRARGTSAYNSLHGYMQHAVHHAGQISVLRQLVS